MVEETVKDLKKRGIRSVGITATSGTVRTELFQNELKKHGMTPVIPSEEEQKKVMHIIYDRVKANLPPEEGMFEEVCEGLYTAGAENVILGCTELSLLKRDGLIPNEGVTDALESLARASLEYFSLPVKHL